MKLALNSQNLHHAYFLEGERAALKIALTSFLTGDLKVAMIGNPDYLYQEFETFGVNDARAVKESQEKRNFGEGKRVFVIAFNFITGEAQNALLKMFEEPGEDTYFFIIAPTSAILLPTLRSRLIILRYESASMTDAKKFLRASIDERLKLTEKFKDADNEAKKSELLALVSDIERELSESSVRDANVFSEMYSLKKFLLERSPSVKMIAEFLALRLPIQK